MKFVVVGAGSVGSWLAAHLAHAGHATTLVARGARAVRVGSQGITVQGRHTFRARPTVVSGVLDAYDGCVPAATWLAVKSRDIRPLAQSLAPIQPHPIVCLQNGVGNEELLDSALPGWGIIAAAVTTSLGLDSTEVHVYKRGGMAMAPLVPPGDVDRLAACLTAAGVESVTHENYRAVKWSKLLLNIVCNATCAILNWSPARVLADRRLLQLEREAVGEALAVMAALGLKPVPLPGYPLPSALKLRHLPDWLLGPVVRLAAARGRGGKPPSLLQDLSAARHHLEVDVLNGAVAQHAHQLGVPAPVNEALAGLLGDIADGGRPWHEFRDRPAALLAEVARYRTAPGAPTVSASP